MSAYTRAMAMLEGAGARARSSSGSLMKTGVTLATIGGSAGLLSFLAAFARARNVTLGPVLKNGEVLGVPISLAGALVAGVLAHMGRGGANPHLMNVAIGGATAWLTTAGIKLGYRGTNLAPAIGQLPMGYAGQIGGYHYGPQYSYVGATPETERLFREAGVP